MAIFNRADFIARAEKAARQKKFLENQAKQGNARAISKLKLYDSPNGIKAKRAADAQKQREKKFQERQAIAPTYRDSYEVGEITSFEGAKQAADETYMQHWYDRANEISSKWEDEDYTLIAEPQYERYNQRTGQINSQFFSRSNRTRRVVPEGYDEYVEAQERINAGPLNFLNDNVHYQLINPPSSRGYGKQQYWINENDPLRQAVEAQADVMKEYLDENNIPLYVNFPEGTSIDGLTGEGVYLNTGTGAHIDWDAPLKRQQKYLTSSGSELGSYSKIFVRPKSEGFGKPLSILGALTGNPIISAAGTIASGGDIGDVVKNVATNAIVSKIDIPVLEDSFASLGVDADLLGMEAAEFSDRMMDVQSDILTGESGTDALLNNFGKAAIGAVADTVDIDIDLPESELLSDLGDALEPIVGAVREAGSAFDDAVLQPIKTGLEPVVDVAQQGIDVVQQAGRDFDDTFIDPIDNALDTFGKKVVDPVLQAGSDVLSEGEDLLKEAGYVIDDLVDWESLLKAAIPSGGRTASTPTEDLFQNEIYNFKLKDSPDKIFNEQQIQQFSNQDAVAQQNIQLVEPKGFLNTNLFADEEEEEYTDLFATTV